jgi:ubiquitin
VRSRAAGEAQPPQRAQAALGRPQAARLAQELPVPVQRRLRPAGRLVLDLKLGQALLKLGQALLKLVDPQPGAERGGWSRWRASGRGSGAGARRPAAGVRRPHALR